MKRLLTAAAAGALFLASCSDDVVVNDFQDSKPTSTINFRTRDQITGDLLDSVAVTRLSYDTLVKYTDVDGFTRFTGVQIGEYIFRFQREGYATLLLDAGVYDLSGDVPRVPDYNYDVELPKLGASVEGRVFYSDANGNKLAVEEATVLLKLSNISGYRWPSEYITATTDEEGNYSFTNLPEGVGYTISVRQMTVGGKVYSYTGSLSYSDVLDGEVKKATALTLTILGNPLTVTSTNFNGDLKVSTEDVVVLNFSEVVDSAAIKFGDIIVSVGGDQVLTTAAWSNGYKTLTLSPVDGAWWKNSSHAITLSLQSLDRVILSGGSTYYFTPADAVTKLPGQASKLKTTFSGTGIPSQTTSSFTLSWMEGTDAAGYSIYLKTSEDSAFVWVKNVIDDTTTTIYSDFSEGKILSYRVLSYNDLGTATVSSAPAISLRDSTAPTDANTSLPVSIINGALGTSPDNSLGATDLQLTNQVVYFNEAMDTTVVPTISSENTAVKYSWKWIDIDKARVYVIIPTGQDASGVSSTGIISLAVLKDMAGNKLSYADTDAELSFVDNH